ncbi:hypothetical protein Tcan_10024 [Toxocara canis]|uniref:Uncharacterized protein n=1 Tax=Toxocara canis TaxID=6265 RepID=A0A0B2W3M6_TOXCA|nr:hypothetical protein Tcan_10024 [Toxocara canis]
MEGFAYARIWKNVDALGAASSIYCSNKHPVLSDQVLFNPTFFSRPEITLRYCALSADVMRLKIL